MLRFVQLLPVVGLVLFGTPLVARADTVSLAWDPSPSVDVAGYHLLVGVQPGQPTQQLDVGPVVMWQLDLPGGQTYYLSVRAYNAAGVSSPSDEIAVAVAAPAPVDCVVSEWGAWTPTTDWGACYVGQQARQETRSRTVLTAPANGGQSCPILTETRTVYQACVDVCAMAPLAVAVTSWPTNKAGKGLQYTSSHAVASYAVFTTKNLVTAIAFTDVRSCQTTVQR
jgi:hypothetical protein